MKPTLFGTKYPIVCAPMFQVSDIKLALAVANEGCLPTFHSRDLTQILEYKSITNSNKFGIFVELIGHPRETYILDFLKHINPQMVEMGLSQTFNTEYFKNFVEHAKDNGIKLVQKLTTPKDNRKFIVNIKGSEAAGLIGKNSTKENFLKQKSLTLMEVCCSGGVADSNDLDWFIEKDASAIFIGTAFAMTKESSISEDVKIKLLNKNINDLKHITTDKRNGIVFDINTHDDDENGTQGLKLGVTNKGGHVYMGHALEKITDIISVKELVKNLVQNSKYLKDF